MAVARTFLLLSMVLACLFSCTTSDESASQTPSADDFSEERRCEQASEDLLTIKDSSHRQPDQPADIAVSEPEVIVEDDLEEPQTTVVSDGARDSDHSDDIAKKRPPKVVMQAIGPYGMSEEDGDVVVEKSVQGHKDESWTERNDVGVEQKRGGGGRRFFSLMNLIKFLLNPVIEEFQEVEKSNSSDISSKTAANSSEAAEKDDSKNTTDSGKKTKFLCVGRNVTENTTALVRVVNSTVLLELLSFGKNQTVSDCVLVMFYAPWCHFCAATAPHYNALARAFPQLDVLAVDTVHFSNLNARFGTVAVPNIMLFHQSRSAVRFNHTERHFETLVQFIKNTTGLEANSSVTVTEEDFVGPLPSTPTEETDYLLWFAWIFLVVCGGHLFVQSQPGQRAIERVKILWQEHQHIE